MSEETIKLLAEVLLATITLALVIFGYDRKVARPYTNDKIEKLERHVLNLAQGPPITVAQLDAQAIADESVFVSPRTRYPEPQEETWTRPPDPAGDDALHETYRNSENEIWELWSQFLPAFGHFTKLYEAPQPIRDAVAMVHTWLVAQLPWKP